MVDKVEVEVEAEEAVEKEEEEEEEEVEEEAMVRMEERSVRMAVSVEAREGLA